MGSGVRGSAVRGHEAPDWGLAGEPGFPWRDCMQDCVRDVVATVVVVLELRWW